MNKNKIEIKSFFKLSETIINFIIKTINDNKTITVKKIKIMIFNDYKINISMQLIYNLLKKKGYVYKKFKINNNQYSIEDQVLQFEKVNKVHNKENINKCISLDEISFYLGSKPTNGWFKINELGVIQSNSKKIIRKRYSLLVASSIIKNFIL